MARVIGIHRFALKPGVKSADFETIMRERVLKDFTAVFHFDRRLSHGFTRARWGSARHLLFQSNEPGKEAEYIWLMEADVDDDKVATDEDREKTRKESDFIAKEYYDLTGVILPGRASTVLAPFATHLSAESFLDTSPLDTASDSA